jgi:hypothetical protein
MTGRWWGDVLGYGAKTTRSDIHHAYHEEPAAEHIAYET